MNQTAVLAALDVNKPSCSVPMVVSRWQVPALVSVRLRALQKQKKPASLSGRGPDVPCEALMGRFKRLDRQESERRGRRDGGKNSSGHIDLLLVSAHVLIV
jgi:hypothetical protein